ncbi:hypothetical protein JRQ81_005254, partial [Phrynocephalus forsythii]
MKIFAILSAVLFFILMAVPATAGGPTTRTECERVGGKCYHVRCPPETRPIGHCADAERFPCC